MTLMPSESADDGERQHFAEWVRKAMHDKAATASCRILSGGVLGDLRWMGSNPILSTVLT